MKILFLYGKLSHKRHKSKTLLNGNDFYYLAIHTSLAPFELAWLIDQKLDIPFRCEPNPFIFRAKDKQSEHLLYFFEGDEQKARAWLLVNQSSHNYIVNSKPLVDYLLLWENDEDFPMESFWISRLMQESQIQMAYLYPEEKSAKFTWCFDLPYLIPN